MTYDNEDDLFDEEFDFVDEEDDDLEDDDSELEADAEEDSEPAGDEQKDDEVEKKKPAAKKKARPTKASGGKRKSKAEAAGELTEPPSAEAEAADEAEPEIAPGPPTDHVVHLYEFGNFTRTIVREFTSEEAEAFATEYNRTSNAHSRQAVVAGKDEEHALSVTPHTKTASG